MAARIRVRAPAGDLHLSVAGINVSDVLDTFDAAAVHRWCAVGLDALRRHQVEIDQLNVFPVPDGDTGTNLVLTVSSAWQALAAEPDPVGRESRHGPVALASHDGPAELGASSTRQGGGAADAARLGHTLRCMARGALLGARGNSGVIVAQLLRGTADALATVPVARGRAMAGALTEAAKAAYSAVAEPVEGTVLSVATAAAAAAVAADSDDLATVVRAAAQGAVAALARTPEQLPVLARAGVVDAGGRGLVVLLQALVAVVTGQPTPAVEPAQVAPSPRPVTRETGSAGYAYEVQYLLDAPAEAVEILKGALAALGDSLVVVGTAGALETAGKGNGVDPEVPTWNVHVHVNDVGAAVEAGVEAGRPHRISVTRFADEASRAFDGVPTSPGAGQAEVGRREQTALGQPTRVRPALVQPALVQPARGQPAYDEDARGVVVVVAGSGLASVFTAEGAVVVDGGPTRNPSTAVILDAIRATGAGRVVLMPNDPNVQAVAAVAAEEARATGVRVGVVPTRSPVQALAAIAVRDPARRFNDDVIAMAEAAGACRYAEVTFATRAALTIAGRCEPGDVLALVEGEVNLIGDSLPQTCVTLLDRMLAGGGELVTAVLGADAPPDLGELLSSHVARQWPFVEAHIIDGGQAHYPLLVGVE